MLNKEEVKIVDLGQSDQIEPDLETLSGAFQVATTRESHRHQSYLVENSLVAVIKV